MAPNWADRDPTLWYTGVSMRGSKFKDILKHYVIEYWSTLNYWVYLAGSCDFSAREKCILFC